MAVFFIMAAMSTPKKAPTIPVNVIESETETVLSAVKNNIPAVNR
jgi:F0F1-type ATP synthase membrane subunit a